ncbi:trans-sulfuration enzyme family protein [Streptomyces demainii]|uniref:Methionine-gamma-lyase n=1 Tax=Streptomyces demainii TaxID=588122 RepID=A0ABT9L6Z1_9ACTN|nr:aminotransferase class I/II-fold pyridoxal phosphate-dependent enzyme [Streptomyces demainii]MDP9616471.1 methionine-gamma-lyase [Streptomyces demainii]
MDSSTSLETLLLCADRDAGERDIAPPLHLSVPFASLFDESAEVSGAPHSDRFYRRYGHPTQTRLEKVMSAAEGAEAALATASGMGAISTALLALLSQGDHVIGQRSMYAGTLSLLQDLAPRLGIHVSLVDQTDPSAFEQAVTHATKLIMVETPSNPLLHLTDLAAVSALAKEHGIVTIADNTVATPVNQHPLELGIDLVVHSLTKAASGHSDALAGIIAGAESLIDVMRRTHVLLGSVISPFDAWLTLRGLRTMLMRVEKHNRNALAVARFLAAHPRIAAVHYPGLSDHPQHALAVGQSSGFGGLLSFEICGGKTAAEGLLSSLRIPANSASLGGTRSLAVRPAAMWTRELTENQSAEAGLSPGLVRFAVGLEQEDDLIADLGQALDSLPAE